MANTQYVIGYGSLLQTQSRNRTIREGAPIVPVRVHGCHRLWNAQPSKVGLGATFLGARRERGATLNAVAIEVTEADIQALDKRERQYERVKVDAGDLEFLANPIEESGEYWIYLFEHGKDPTEQAPIIQSYVDICLSGSIELEERFDLPSGAWMEEFVATTGGWSRHWVNDRLYPRAPHIACPQAHRIDEFLAEKLPDQFAAIRIE